MLVLTPPELIASKILSLDSRRGQPKSFTDQRDLAVLLLTLPDLKTDEGPVADCLRAGIGAGCLEGIHIAGDSSGR